jgi:hypothetical protein
MMLFLLFSKTNIFPLFAKSHDTYKETGDHARLPAQLAGDMNKDIKIVCGEEKHILSWGGGHEREISNAGR